MNFTDKNIIILGAGISGIGAAKTAHKLGAEVTLCDAKPAEQIKYDLSELRNINIKLVLGQQKINILKNADMVILSPAVALHIPLLDEVRKLGIKIISEIEFAWYIASAPIYAVTGTNGKTTTTVLLGLLMKKIYERVGVGGNIGVPLCEEVQRVADKGCTVAEISSYQLESSHEFCPHIAAVLNITPDHIARHGSMEIYQQMKEKIFVNQTKQDFLVLNYDDLRTRNMAERAKSTVMFFSRAISLEEGVFALDSKLMIKWRGREYLVCGVDEIGIKGGHNVENALAATATAFLAGVSPAQIADVLRNFSGVEHRIEAVKEIAGVKYFNDSKATNTDAAIKALETFDGHVVLIAGGHDKKTDLTEFMRLASQRVDKLILLGEAAARFREAAILNGIRENNIVEAGYSMKKAVSLARQYAVAPQVVLLSPACSSFDMYDGYEERGRDFKKIVNELE
ncbi:UDP-N-acetylmuramoyl-L-alanine--D-glutamate ligase [Pectinatus haikarae]|uniref:UDP-N-acetylmuramoylalanine--D-glutamate ligase n=1 Tax=Pectinatus haikarae TaxID=349096 RepID=A0ABT9Y6N2_9FIRM|nr:UDP-N-acetylmuramoyl-L-alanine--D-glutamate ligase [Pectinatus haikarae]MDQ0203479.1 UDP-N-acetylmuramoylalanine--D-glutamate ligase [Pectinatus haikarae]